MKDSVDVETLTLSTIKADVGSIGGHTRPSSEMLYVVEDTVNESNLSVDFIVNHTGDDIAIFMTHRKGVDSEEIHRVAWDAFMNATEVAKESGLYGAGQDLLKDSFAGNVRGMGPAVAEMEITPRPSEAVLLFAADKCAPGAYNLPLYLAFCDPMHNSGHLLSAKHMGKGFTFTIMDVSHTEGDKVIALNTPEDLYDIAALLRDNDRFVVESVHSRTYPDEQVAAVSTSRLHNIAGQYTGKDDPVAVVRTQKQFPAPEEVVSPYKIGHFVLGDARGSHVQPLSPEPVNEPITTPFCIPIVSCQAISVNREGKIAEPVDMFATGYWQYVRERVYRKAEEMREQGFSGPAMGHISELEYGGIGDRLNALKERFRVRQE